VILEAAARLFFERGYQSTSVGQIAAEAGVAVQTIYNSLGSKRDVLERVLELAVAGEGATDDADPSRIVEQLIERWSRDLPTSAPISRVIRDAATVDPAIAALSRRRTERRLADCESAARALEQGGLLRSGLTVRRAAATMYAVSHPEIYRELVLEGPWDDTLWATWARSTLRAALLA
jgi:AcrR family transcriptional regulator